MRCGRPSRGRAPATGDDPCRRSFLAGATRASAALAATSLLPWTAACASVPVITPTVTGRSARIPISVFDGVDGLLFRHPEEEMPVYVHRHGARRFTAVLTRCTHRGCGVEAVGTRLVCPCHGSEYRPDGSLLRGPAERSLVRYPTSSDDTHVSVGLDPTGRDR